MSPNVPGPADPTAEAALRGSEERLTFLLEINDALRSLSDPHAVLEVASRLLGEHVHASRVQYADIDHDEFIVRHSYANGVPPFAGRGPVNRFGATVVEAFRRGEGVVVDDVQTDPRFTERERATLLSTEIAAFAGVMMTKGGRWVGAFGVHSATPRHWTRPEIDLIRDVAERTWEAFERARAEAALRLANQELRESEDRFSVIHDRAPFAISLTSPDGKIISVNDAFEELFEFSREEIEGKTRVELGISNPELNAALVEELERTGALRHFEVRRRTKSGAERVLLLSIDPVTIAEREFLLTTAIDVTEKTRAEAALREREWRLRLALDASGAGSWTRDPRTHSADWDDRLRVMYGFTPDEPATFDAWLNRVHPDDRQRVLGVVADMLQTSDAWDATYRIKKPDGTVSWIQSLGRAERDPTGTVTRLTGLDFDITERRRLEEARQAQRDEVRNRELRLLLETAAQGILSVDAQGLIVTANHAVETMFGWEPGCLIGQSVERLVPVLLRDTHAQHRATYMAAPHPRPMGGDLDLVGLRKDGTTFPIEVSLNHVATPDGGHTLAFVTDITERHQAKASLQERTIELERRTAQLSRMASDLTLAEQRAREQLARTLHDGLQQLLVLASLNLDEQLKRDRNRETDSIDLIARAKAHVDEAAAAARSLSVELFPPLLHSSGLPIALAWLADSTKTKYGLEVRLSADPRANSDRRDVRTLLFESVRELLFNVVKHAQVDSVTVDLVLDGDDCLCITVTDRGIGFDPIKLADLERVGPTGWGLFSIRERLMLLGGRLEIESAPGQGTRFRLVVPRRDRPAATGLPSVDLAANIRAARSTASSLPSRALRLLIVDDHDAMRTRLREMLQARPELQVIGEAANGREAIAQAYALMPDLILMDVSMPDMDGVEATRRLHEELPLIRILGLSVQPRLEGPHDIEQAGAVAFFNKADMHHLLDHVLAMHAAEVAL
ncbi:MAG TPA: PAS domain S-box protein [Vicinamibacterales bacterium]|nr:PAS domain S-box protein [Vicinamibacterales bacterium]